MKFRISFLLSFLFVLSVCGQNSYTIHGTISNAPSSRVVISSLYGDSVEILDTIPLRNGSFEYIPSEAVHYGMLMLDVGNKVYIKIIYCNEDVAFETSAYDPVKFMEIKASQNNEAYYQYLKSKDSYERRLGILANALNYYPDDDPFFFTLQEEYLLVVENQKMYTTELINDESGLLAFHYIHADIIPNIPDSIVPGEQLAWMQDHFFDYIDFNDTEILYSDILPSKVIEYIKLFANRNLTKKQLESAYINGVEHLMSFVIGHNPDVEEVIVNHMVKGFQQLEFQEVLTYVVEHYVLESSCIDEGRKHTLERRIEGFKKMGEGAKVPEYAIVDQHGTVINNTNQESTYRLILFWASWCPHCLAEMTDIAQRTAPIDATDLTVVMVSIDEKKEEWEAAKANHPKDWLESCDFKGWDSKIVNDFYIYATPSMVIVDKEGNILATPINVGQLSLALEKLGI